MLAYFDCAQCKERKPTNPQGGTGYGYRRDTTTGLDAWFVGPPDSNGARHVWHALNLGDNDIARCKRTKTLWVDLGNGRGWGPKEPKRDRTRKGVQA